MFLINLQNEKTIEFRTETQEEMINWILAIDIAAGNKSKDWIDECEREENLWAYTTPRIKFEVLLSIIIVDKKVK